LEDLRSKNGTHRNGVLISSPVILHDGDVIHIALAQKFVFLSADATLPLDPEESLEIIPGQRRQLILEKLSHRVWIDDEEVNPPLSVSQFRLLEILYEHHGKLVSRDDVMKKVYGSQEAFGVTEQALDALVRRLRERLSSIDPEHNYVVTIRGHGLRLDNPISNRK
jgi:pSer/pThr/pTyr-binding forkhead associated (FHA) protein